MYTIKKSAIIYKEIYIFWRGIIMENQTMEPQQVNTPVEDTKKKFAIAGFVLGLCGLGAWFLPILGLPVGIVGIVMGVKGLKSTKKTFAIIGLVLSILCIVASVVNMIVGAIAGAQAAANILATYH